MDTMHLMYYKSNQLIFSFVEHFIMTHLKQEVIIQGSSTACSCFKVKAPPSIVSWLHVFLFEGFYCERFYCKAAVGRIHCNNNANTILYNTVLHCLQFYINSARLYNA